MVEAAAAHAGLRVVSDQPTVVPHTFMGWDPKSVERLHNGHGELFPVFLTWRDALDNRVIDLMCPLFATQSLLHKTRRNVDVHQRNPMSLPDIPTKRGSPDCVHSVYHQIGRRPSKHVKLAVELNSVSQV